jgi:stage II sporulation protein D
MRRPDGTGRVDRNAPPLFAAPTRRSFVAACSSALAATALGPRAALATGGLDVTDTESDRSMRVLLATGSYSPAQQLDSWHFAWNGRTYRGTFATVVLIDGQSALVNTLPLDAYLYGVLSKEVSPAWAPAAQQAQAIVSRTYALAKIRPAKPYDVTAGDADQNYGGIESESVEGRAAVDATASTIVTYATLPARVAYSSCCGGRTASAGDVWNTPYPYLISVVDPNCASTPNFSWQVEVPLHVVERALRTQMSGCGMVHGVQLRVDTAGARPRAIDFVGDSATVETPLQIFRTAVGAGVVLSTFVHDAVLNGNGDDALLALAGTGRGHGVGLCQWGARSLGQTGATAQDIVSFYFPGTSLGRA